jgi:hypothetical protein
MSTVFDELRAILRVAIVRTGAAALPKAFDIEEDGGDVPQIDCSLIRTPAFGERATCGIDDRTPPLLPPPPPPILLAL